MVIAAETPIVGTGRDYTHLVQDYRVHASQYTDVILEGEGRTKSVARDNDGGHVELDFRRSYTTELAWLGAPCSKVSAYCDDLEEAYGAEKAKSIMWDGPPHAFVFPNLFLGEMNIGRIDPLAPGLTEHYHTPLLVESSDPGINRRVVLQSEAAMGPASFFLPEDVVIAERMHRAFDVGGATRHGDEATRHGDEYEAGSNFVLYEHAVQATNDMRIWVGRTTHRLRRTDEGLRIARKKVELANSTSALPNMAFII